MKLNKETLYRIKRTQVNLIRHSREPIEDRYTFSNVFKANAQTNWISLPYLFSKVHHLRFSDSVNKENGLYNDPFLCMNINQLSEIIEIANPQLKKNTPEYLINRGKLGYEFNSPYGDDFTKDKRKINIESTLNSARNIDEKSNLAFLFAMQTGIVRCLIDPNSIFGYYSSRIPKISEEVVEEVLDHFDLYHQFRKGLFFAERMKRYDSAVKFADTLGEKYAKVECLYLDGKTEDALELLVECARSPDGVKNWLLWNSEIDLLKKSAPRIQGMLEERLNRVINYPEERGKYNNLESIQLSIQEIKKFIQ